MDPGPSVSPTPPPTGSLSHSPHPPPPSSLPIRHRRRPALSCVLCRQRKVKCDRNAPCRQCVHSGNKNCTYASSSSRVPAPLPEIEKRNEEEGVKARAGPPGVIVFNSAPEVEKGREKKETNLFSSKIRIDSNDNKIKFMGHSHWRARCEEFDIVKQLIHRQDHPWAKVQGLLKQCKATIKEIRTSVKAEQLICFDPKDCIPPRELCDDLVDLYLKTFETTFRVLHVPSFWREYGAHWNDPQSSSPAFIMKLLLVLAIGAAFHQSPPPCLSRSTVMSWIFTAKSWIHSSAEDLNLNIASIQIQCLLIIARQSNDISTAAIPLLSSTLLRTAMVIGLHRDPSLLRKLPFYHQETRKRLWATVLELAVQSSPGSGMPPLVSTDDYDCPPPLNLNDEDFDEWTTKAPTPHPGGILTQTSWQIALLKSMPTRIAITKLIEKIHSNPSYESVLQLSSSLTMSYESIPPFFHLHNSTSDPQSNRPSSFQKHLLDLCTRRFLLYLHFPFAILSRETPQYYFSRKICLESSLVLLAYPVNTNDEIAQLRTSGGGMYKTDFFSSCTAIFTELHLRSSESSLLGPSPAEVNQPLFTALRKFIAVSKTRIASAQDNVKAHFLISLLFAQFHGDDTMKEAFDVASYCLATLRARLDSLRAEKQAHAQVQGQVGGAAELAGLALPQPQLQPQPQPQENLEPEIGVNLDLPMDFTLDPSTGDFNSLNWIFEEWDDNLL